MASSTGVIVSRLCLRAVSQIEGRLLLWRCQASVSLLLDRLSKLEDDSTVARVSPLRLTYVLLVKPSLLATGAMSGQCVSTVGAFGEGGVML